ncbi:MAG: endonuclease domain-containing protein [Candidatus Riflemargulisbacteria bacterium]
MIRKLVQKNSLLPFNPKIMDFVKTLRKNMTKEEKKLWYDFLRDFEYKFTRQKPIDNYIVDFYCAKAKLAIEVDGSHHYTEDGMVYDSVRSEILEAYGIKVIRFSNLDIKENFEGVCEAIKEQLIPPQSAKS